jgi:hypothetical protein
MQSSPKPKIMCPHCENSFDAGQLPARRLYRTKLGIDVFSCPSCKQGLKIEPTEYMFAKSQIESGEAPEGAGIVGFRESELTPSEKAAQRENRGIFSRIFGR